MSLRALVRCACDRSPYTSSLCKVYRSGRGRLTTIGPLRASSVARIGSCSESSMKRRGCIVRFSRDTATGASPVRPRDVRKSRSKSGSSDLRNDVCV